MAYITVGQQNATDIDVYFEDHGSGRPVVLIHGFPLNGRSWEKVERVLLNAGHRVITYDRRGFGNSSRPSTGYEYDTLTDDLDALMESLDLRDTILVGHSMGTGEVIRCVGRNGSERVSKAVLVSPLGPYLLKADDNPLGVDGGVFSGIQEAIVSDRPRYLKAFFDAFFNVGKDTQRFVSEEAWRAHWNVGVSASLTATLECVASWLTDFRDDVMRVEVPVLILHGDADNILPIDATARRLPGMMRNARLIELAGAPHSLPWSHADAVAGAVVEFIAEG